MDQPRILSIDDDPFYRDLYRNILEPKGFTFLSALNPGDGFDMAATAPPDLIMLDITMPEQRGFADGFGLLEAFRRHPVLKKTPILMVSALGDKTDIEHGLALGASDYLPKPEMTPAGLDKKIKNLLKKRT